jgi:hypothetical protein
MVSAEGGRRDDRAVEVASYDLRHQADLAVSYLAAHGIKAWYTADDCGGADPALGFATGTRVFVGASHVERALLLLHKLG